MKMKKIFLVRHCEATGQPADSELTANGFKQASQMVEILQKFDVKRVIASPFTRAVQSIEPFCQASELLLETDERLVERDLGLGIVDDWLERYRVTFEDVNVKYGDGESSHEAMQRILSVIEEAESQTLLVSHGNLVALALMYYGQEDGFTYWERLSNPDLFVLTVDEQAREVERLWDR